MSENEQNFDALRRLLALKRHEIPPPGYFDSFSGQVIARIRAGEVAREMPWLLRFLQAFEARPAYPVAFASSLCMLLLFGIVSVQQNPGFASVAFTPGPGSPGYSTVSSPSMTGGSPQLIADVTTNSPSNQAQDNSAYFNPTASRYFQQASYSFGGN